MKYRKKPVVIEAVQLTRLNIPIVLNFLGAHVYKYGYESNGYEDIHLYCYIKTLEGVMRADEGDYIIKGIRGEFYPCKKHIFEETYEEVEE